MRAPASIPSERRLPPQVEPPAPTRNRCERTTYSELAEEYVGTNGKLWQEDPEPAKGTSNTSAAPTPPTSPQEEHQGLRRKAPQGRTKLPAGCGPKARASASEREPRRSEATEGKS